MMHQKGTINSNKERKNMVVFGRFSFYSYTPPHPPPPPPLLLLNPILVVSPI
jgi:hypothetical protein